MTNTPTSKTTEEQPDKIGMLCRVHLKAEVVISTVVAFIIALPGPLAVGFYRLGVFIIAHVIPAMVWIVSQIVPFIRLLYRGVMYLIYIGACIIATIVSVAIDMLAWVYHGILRLYRWINWCAVRSILRMLSMVSGIVSTIYIIYATITVYKIATIITGRFEDSNSMVYMIHVAIVILLFAISIYYNAWAYSSEEERTFVCKRAIGLEKIHGWLK